MKVVLFISYCFSKKTIFLSLCHKDLKKHFLMKILKNPSNYISRKLKHHQHRIRSKTGILLKIILNVFRCLLVSLAPLKLLLWQ